MIREHALRSNEPLFGWHKGRNVLEQRFLRFVPVDHELMPEVIRNQPLKHPALKSATPQLQEVPVLLHDALSSLVLGKPPQTHLREERFIQTGRQGGSRHMRSLERAPH